MRKYFLLSTALTLSLLLQPFSGLATSARTVDSYTRVDAAEADDPGEYRLGNQGGTTLDATAMPNVSSFTLNPSFRKSSQGVSPFTGSTYTHADAFDGMNIYHGIDVSKYQPNINWTKVKDANVDYVIIRLGYRGYSGGTLNEDPYYKKHIEGALAAGLKVGVYFFTQAINVDEAVAEAQYTLQKISGYDVTMPIAIDFEWPTENGKPVGRMYDAGLTKAQYTTICRAFCDIIASNGYTPMVYANSSDLKNNINGATLAERYTIWLANYTTKTSYTNPYEFWQYSSSGTVDGISGRVDCNFWYTKQNINNITTPSTGAAVSISSGKIAAIADQTYTGSALTPSMKVTVNDKTLSSGTDYSTTYSNNINAGTATVTITGKGNYTDSLSSSFTIYPKKVSGLKGASAAKRITLSWSSKTGASGYQIYRKDTYNGSYKKVKTITGGTVSSWKNTGLSTRHEYYYRIRSFAKADSKTIYSDYANLTAATKPSSQVGIANKSLKLLKKPSNSAKKLVTVTKGTSLVYTGITHLKNKKTFYHVQYVTKTKTYDGYLPIKSSLKFYKQGTTMTRLNMRKTASISSKLLCKIPNRTAISIQGKKKVKGTVWYKTSYSGQKGKIYAGYVSSNYIE